ncbi:MAG: hypothetical protein GXO27_01285 [Chlorobi bacterium]|nr:hypothetical protein [Chlorobiota bacterium]
MKKKTFYGALAALAGIGILLVLKNYLLALTVGILALLLWGAWKTILDLKEKENTRLAGRLERLEARNEALRDEIERLRRRKLHITGVDQIMELGVMEIHTSFTRTWDKKFVHNQKDVHFIGALKVKLSASYGVDMKSLRFKEDPSHNRLLIAGLRPKLLAFKDINYIWEIAEILEYKKPFIGAGYWRKSKELQELGAQIKEELRLQTHEEVKQGPEEMEWMLRPIQTHLIQALRVIFGAPGLEVEVTDEAGPDFLSLEEYVARREARPLLSPPRPEALPREQNPSKTDSPS